MPSPSLLKSSGSKTLTPQRKHHKLLKDGSGAEVWPEAIESVFVQGLREYWRSPWANYSQSRGRSRWRNQYLVDYLQKNGINRSKKQVASHIQVLRNMWKGQPEFYLVAGGDEVPTPESGVKMEDQLDSPLIPFEHEDSPPLSATASPNYSPPDSQSDFPPSPPGSSYPYSIASPYKELPDVNTNNTGLSLHPQNTIFTASLPTSFSSYPMDIATSYQDMTPPLMNQYYALDNLQPVLPQASDPPRNATNTNNATNFFYPPGPARATAITLTAHGMTPFSVNLEALTAQRQPQSPSTTSALALRIRLGITSPPSDGTELPHQHHHPTSSSSPSSSGNSILPQLHGFSGTVSLSRVWSQSGKCLTRVHQTRNGGGATCIGTESSALEITNVDAGTAIAVLPQSALSKCRWFDKGVQTRISQEIIIDNETVLYLVYELDRNRGALPSAELVGYKQKDRALSTPSSLTSPVSSYPASNHSTAYGQTSLNQPGLSSYYPSPMTTNTSNSAYGGTTQAAQYFDMQSSYGSMSSGVSTTHARPHAYSMPMAMSPSVFSSS